LDPEPKDLIKELDKILRKAARFKKKRQWPNRKRLEIFRGINMGTITDSEASRKT
jgi:hypothetical protein